MSEAMQEQGTEMPDMDVGAIMSMIPHRYPMLLVDRMINVRRNQSAVGIKNVTINEQFFEGHFPGHPIMPGVMIVEAMAQTAGVLVVASLGQPAADQIVYFMSIDEARFRKPVVPGDRLELHVSKLQERRSVYKFEGKAIVDGKVHAEAVFTAMIMKREAA
jgi:3-hydroxyacyl-[acyl-carrier-protein] dehydratase